MTEEKEKIDLVFISISSDIQCYNIRRISSYLKRNGFKTKIIFLPQPFAKRYSQEIIKQVVDICEGSKLVGISFMSNFFHNAVQIIDAIKSRSSVPIIGGGSHASTNPNQCLEKLDMVESL